MASEIPEHDRLVPDLRPPENVEEENTPAGGSSDGEGGERTARERLKKTSIAGLSQHSKSGAGGVTGDHPLSESMTADVVTDPPNENGGSRGRPSKKRSFEDLQNDDHAGPTENGSIGSSELKRPHHKRMRSRDVSGGNGQEIGKFEEPASPVHEESDDEVPGGAGVLVDSQTKIDTNAQRSLEDKILEEEDTTHEPTIGVAPETGPPSTTVQQPQQADSTQGDTSTKASTLSPQSGFANVSSTSPFGATKSPPPASKEPAAKSTDSTTTSSSAFASSGISAFASSEKSPFGAASSAQASGGFGGGGSGFGGAKPSGFGSGMTGFGAPSAFGSKPLLGLGSTGGFGAGAAPRPFGGTISSFAGPTAGSGAFGKGKPFGAKDKEDEDDDRSDDGDDEDQKQDDEQKPDSRFHHQKGMFSTLSPSVYQPLLTFEIVETGEEEEETIFNARAKLFHFEDKQWKERGVGNLKINVRYEPMTFPDESNGNGESADDDLEGGITPMARKGRVLMRTDGVHRVILNSPVFKEMNVGTKDGEEPTGRTMMLTGMEEGRPKGFQVKVSGTHPSLRRC